MVVHNSQPLRLISTKSPSHWRCASASALAIVSIVIALLLVALYSYTQQKMSNAEELESSSSGDDSFKSITSWWWKIVVGIYTLITSIFVLGPLLSIVYRSFFSSASRTGEMVFSFQNYKKLFHSISSLPSQTFQSLVNSLLIATCSSLIAIIFGTMLSSRLVTSTKRQQFSLELFAMLTDGCLFGNLRFRLLYNLSLYLKNWN